MFNVTTRTQNHTKMNTAFEMHNQTSNKKNCRGVLLSRVRGLFGKDDAWSMVDAEVNVYNRETIMFSMLK